ncbi:MAG: holin family protein [Pseudomonadota bacterium]
MGLMRTLLGLGRAAKDISEVFVENKTQALNHTADRFAAAQNSYTQETATSSRFDQWVNALNRLPRPCLALGTVGLFAYAMIDPQGFAGRMEGLSFVPEPLWWLLGAIVSFYFGARELHHFRTVKPAIQSQPMRFSATTLDPNENAALEEWAAQNNSGPDWLDRGAS